eukprot:GEMP01026635.1.p1 GENE.GEMP01026635.1~~GEMP01026635.1.p1  ORF type:complete len:665 (+),score=284.88 GEMP01026635.1:226-2220(+)
MRVALLVLWTLVHCDEKARPVTKVINLLKQMGEELEAEATKDQEVFDQIGCWCKTNTREKTQSIKAANALIDQLTSNIEEFSASTARLAAEITQLEHEIDKNQRALNTATALRRKELSEFNAEEKDVLESVQALKAALVVLSKHNQALIQGDALANLQALVKVQLDKHADVLGEVITPSQKRLLHSFIQAPGGFQSYANQSGQIFGILRSMLDTFEANLTSSQREELQAQQQYEQLKAAKEEEIAAGTEQLNTKKEQLGNTKVANAEAKQDLEDTRASLAADTEFLSTVRVKCAQTDADFEARTRDRQNEISAVNEALKILSSDDARDNFTKTFNAGLFLQESGDTRREKAAAVLKIAAKAYQNPRLATLATAVRLDAFTKVKAAIDKMVADLTKEKEDEIKQKDWCTAQLHDNQSRTEARQRDLDQHTASADGLDSDIKTLTANIDTLKAEIAELHVQATRSGENRAKENADFQETVADQRDTKRLLGNAVNALAAAFEKKDKARFAALQQKDHQEPPAKFETYKKNQKSGGVLAMLRQIIADTTQMEAETIRDEDDAQAAYESFVKETNNSVTAKEKSIVNKQAVKAGKEIERVSATRNAKEAQQSLEQLSDENSAVHKSCDFTLKNFDIRQEAREQEVEALRQAKAILSGSNFGAFLQKYE